MNLIGKLIKISVKEKGVMMSSSNGADEKNQLVAAEETREILDLGSSNQLDLTNLSKEGRDLITQKALEAKIAISNKAQEAQIEIQGTKVQLDNFNETVRDASKDGTSITVTHTQTTSVGRTEVVMGNTEKAASGKISRSAAGLEDNTMKILVAVVVGAVLLALFLK